jgi:hypothetical protein
MMRLSFFFIRWIDAFPPCELPISTTKNRRLRLLVKEQYQTAALHVLPARRAFPGCLASLLQKILRKVTRRWFGSTHLLPPCESDFWLLSASIPKLRGNPDIICEMDH